MKNKLKRQISNYLYWGIMTILSIFVVPFAINLLYSKPAILPSFAMAWEANDVLAFYGSLLSATATIYALNRTIKFTRQSQRTERKLSIRPYLETKNIVCEKAEDIPLNESTYICIDQDTIRLQIEFPQAANIRKVVAKKSKTTSAADKTQASLEEREYFKSYYTFIYQISNYGAGNAINVVLQINGKTGTCNFCIPTNESRNIVFVLKQDLIGKNNKSEYLLKLMLRYSDVACLAEYIQAEELLFSHNGKSIYWIGKSKTLPVEISISK